MIAKKNILIINYLKNSSLQVSLQSFQLSILTSLQVQAVSFASSFARISTSTRLYQPLRLRKQSTITSFANENSLYFKGLSFTRLQHRLQTCQLSPLTSLQVQKVSFEVCKEKAIENQSINKFSFATLFAQNQN